jgi:DHA2 family multidrug resistance protein
VFILFPPNRQGIAITLAGVLAVLAPTVGPLIGGWITQTYTWHWLFLINIAPGLIAALGAGMLLPRRPTFIAGLRLLDLGSLALLATFLAALEIGLKQAPEDGWGAPTVLGLLSICAIGLAGCIRRTLRASQPLLDFRLLGDRSFAIGCGLSFVLGIGLFGTIYLMPVFLALVQGHDPLEIGQTMLVTGVSQLLAAPLAVALERRVDGRLMTLVGFGLFGIGLGLSAFQDRGTDFDQMFWPQVVRGVAIMFCLLPPIRLALGHLPPVRVPDASGLFNLTRNLGGAVGIALIDSVIYGRAPAIGRGIVRRLQAGDAGTAEHIGIPLARFLGRGTAPLDADTQTALNHLVERAALIRAINEAWAMLAGVTLAAIVTLLFVRTSAARGESERPALEVLS